MSDVKTIIVKGTITNPFLSAKLVPANDISKGRWNICVSRLIYHLKNDVFIDDKKVLAQEVCSLSTNLVKGSKFTSQNEVATVFQELNMFILQGKKNDKKMINFDSKWSLINNISDELRLYINNLSDDSSIFEQLHCDFYVEILLQRII
jgi:hypothetical protein